MACALPPTVVYVPAAGAFFFWKMTSLDFLNTYIVKFVDVHQFEVPLIFFQKVGNLSKWLCQQDAHRFSVLGAGLNAPICFFPTRNLGEFVDFANLGLNVNLKNRGRPKGGPKILVYIYIYTPTHKNKSPVWDLGGSRWVQHISTGCGNDLPARQTAF